MKERLPLKLHDLRDRPCRFPVKHIRRGMIDSTDILDTSTTQYNSSHMRTKTFAVHHKTPNGSKTREGFNSTHVLSAPTLSLSRASAAASAIGSVASAAASSPETGQKRNRPKANIAHGNPLTKSLLISPPVFAC